MAEFPAIAVGNRVSILRCAPALGLAEYRQHGTVTDVQGTRVTVMWDARGADVRRAADLTID